MTQVQLELELSENSTSVEIEFSGSITVSEFVKGNGPTSVEGLSSSVVRK